jgi:hypothetical protein
MSIKYPCIIGLVRSTRDMRPYTEETEEEKILVITENYCVISLSMLE